MPLTYPATPQVKQYTVKLAYKDHPRDQQIGSVTWKLYLWGLVKCGLCKQVVYIWVVFRVRLTVKGLLPLGYGLWIP